jgi:cysteine desulfurase
MTDSVAYLDYNATSPLRPEAKRAMVEALDRFGNPSSIHSEGRAARAALEGARERIAEIFRVEPGAITFTSGGTEGANWLLNGLHGSRLALLSIEHACVLQGHRFASENVDPLPVSQSGVVDLAALQETASPGSIVAIQAANNETGVCQAMDAAGEIVRAANGFLVCDAVQVIGRVAIETLDAADALFFSGHKFGGPKGVGAVILRRETELQPFIRGGGQERRRRSGTENVAAIVGMAAALEAAIGGQHNFASYARELRAEVEQGIRERAPDAVIFGEGARRLPNTTCFAIPGKKAEMLLIAFDLEGVAVSSGSACTSGKVERSHVLKAMGVPEALCDGAIRVSTGWQTTRQHGERFLTVLERICGKRPHRRAA